jgi:demethylmenaquinone methyltransferase/2-methoxy-6-polyprenyl-1,4-benzoquinol methylase
MIDCASEAAQKDNIPETVDFRKADIFDLPFDDGSFDWVFCKDTLWPGSVATGLMGRTPVAAVKELARVVRPGGTIALLFWSSQMFLPGYPGLEARLTAAFSERVSYLADIEPDRHFLCAMGWLRAAWLEDIGVRCFSDCVHAPLNQETREAVLSCIKMFFEDVDIRTIVSNEDWTAYRRLVDPKSKEYILDRPDYHCFLTYSMFSGIAPSKQR